MTPQKEPNDHFNVSHFLFLPFAEHKQKSFSFLLCPILLQGVCEKSVQDVVERFWDIIEEININKVLRFLRDNIVSEYLCHLHSIPFLYFSFDVASMILLMSLHCVYVIALHA